MNRKHAANFSDYYLITGGPMTWETLLVDTGADFIGRITLNRPNHLNTFNSTMANELYLALLELDADPDVRVIILRGEGKAFCAGIDIREFEGKTAHDYKVWVENMEKPLTAMMGLGTPVVAQVHGVAAANGAGLVAAADLAVAADNMRMGFTAVNVGLFCLGPAIPLMRVVGRKRALELLLFGELIRAPQALEWGLVNRVVPKDDLDAETRMWAASLAARSPMAVRLGKKAFHLASELELTQGFDYMNEAFARLCTTDDAREGVACFLEKRKPEWTGR
jgi:enoyl-CoA hydratase/carnithine racemase